MPSNLKHKSAPPTANKPQPSDYKIRQRNRRKHRRKRKNSLHIAQVPATSAPINSLPVDRVNKLNSKICLKLNSTQPLTLPVNKPAALWNKMYENQLRLHCQYQVDYWKNAAKKLQIENDELKQKLAHSEGRRFVKEEPGEESTSSDDNDFDNTKQKQDFLDFMEISARHKLSRQHQDSVSKD